MIFHGQNLVTKLVVIENKISIITYFKNLIVELHVQYTYPNLVLTRYYLLHDL